jgi:nitrite reductase (NADH) small subunit
VRGLSALIAAPWPRDRYQARVAAVVERYTLLLSPTPRRLPLLLGHPGALTEAERTPPEVLGRHLAAARAEAEALAAGAPLPAPPEADARVRILALADLTWLVRELRVLRRLARRGEGALSASYVAIGRQDALPEPTPELLTAAARLPGSQVRARLVPLLALRHGRSDLAALLWPSGGAPAAVVVGEVREGAPRRVEAFGRTVAVFRRGGALYALDDACPHRGGPLGRGEVDATGAVLCPLHAWAFDLETGLCREHPSVRVGRYRVAEEGGVVRLLGPWEGAE